MVVKHVAGNTYYYDFGWTSIPYYELNPKEIILLDLGLKEEGAILCEYFKKECIVPRAVIHSHIHSDHINGILSLWDDFKFEVYGSMPDLEDGLESFDFSNPQFYDGEMQDLLKASMLYKKIMNNDNDLPEVTVDSATFKIIQSPGHSRFHRTIITPDGVCYFGDLYMAHKTLHTAKLPFTRLLTDDLISKEEGLKYHYDYYLAAHEGEVPKEDFIGVVRQNLDLFHSLSEKLKTIFNNNPNLSYEENVRLFEKEIGLGRHAGVFWIRSTILELYKNMNG